MSPVRSAYVPRFGSQLGSSQRDDDGPQPDHQTIDGTSTTTRTESGNKRGNKLRNVRVENKTRFLFKVKLQKVNNNNLSWKVDKTPRRGSVVSAANKPETTVRRGGGAGSDSEPVDGDIFFFSERPTSPAIKEKEKAKLAVLRTISKMLEENRLIRLRLAVLSQDN